MSNAAAAAPSDHIAPVEHFDKGDSSGPKFDLKEMIGSMNILKQMAGGPQAEMSANQHYGASSDLLPFTGAPPDQQKV